MTAKNLLSVRSHEDMIFIDLFALITFFLFLSQYLELLYSCSLIVFMGEAINTIYS